MLQVLYAEHQSPEEDMSIQQVLLAMRDKLRSSGFSQIPQLSSSRKLDIHTPFTIIPENFSGKRLAVVIAINYVGQQGELRGCQNDAHNMVSEHMPRTSIFETILLTFCVLKQKHSYYSGTTLRDCQIDYIKNVHGFQDEDITILMDDGIHTNPTYDNIMNAFRELVAACEGEYIVVARLLSSLLHLLLFLILSVCSLQPVMPSLRTTLDTEASFATKMAMKQMDSMRRWCPWITPNVGKSETMTSTRSWSFPCLPGS